MGHRKYFILYPFSLLYRIITDIRNLLYDTGILRSHEFGIPVISVGNITVGGTGKTPHVEYLAELLMRDYKAAVLSRGYGRKSRGFRIVTGESDVNEAGDEPVQIAAKFPDILVAVDSDRVHGANEILKRRPETDVIILDDAFQHRRIKPGLSILLSDFNRLVTRDHLMPYGRLREKPGNRKRADIILISKTPDGIPDFHMDSIRKEIGISEEQKLFFTSVCYCEPLQLFTEANTESISLERNKTGQSGIVLVTAIADPRPLKEYLGKYFNEIVHLRFPDHHLFAERDIRKMIQAWNDLKPAEKAVITTEKDSVRLRGSAGIPESMRARFYYLPVKTGFSDDDKQTFDNLILEYVGRNKRIG